MARPRKAPRVRYCVICGAAYTARHKVVQTCGRKCGGALAGIKRRGRGNRTADGNKKASAEERMQRIKLLAWLRRASLKGHGAIDIDYPALVSAWQVIKYIPLEVV